MSEYDFIIDNMRFSYSNLNTFENCRYAWLLTYIQCEERNNNAFGQYGSFIHTILEKFFRNELEVWELLNYYKDNYNDYVTLYFPPYPKGMGEKYYEDGLLFFENFEFDKTNYEVVSIEEEINTKFYDTSFIVKPDIVLKNKKNGNLVLLDYKTKKLKDSKYDNVTIEVYRHQMEIYAYFLWQERNIEINKIFIWFVRNNKFHEIEVNPLKISETLSWMEETINAIKLEKEWSPNLLPKNKYFCQNLCSVSLFCKYKND